MSKSIRILLTALLILVFLFSSTRLWEQQRDKNAGSSAYTEALALATSGKSPAASGTDSPVPVYPSPETETLWVPAAPEEEDPHITFLETLDLEALRQVNPQVVGWILIPDTRINYPLLQGSDNDYYLKRTWDQRQNAVGSIFLEHLSSPDLSDFNTIVYGHNMRDGSMFAGLRKYRDQSYFEEHPYVYIRSDQGVYRYEIFASCLAGINSDAYSLGFPGEEARSRFLDNVLADSFLSTGIRPEITDRILTLSTCSGAGYTTRWVVQARLKMVPVQS